MAQGAVSQPPPVDVTAHDVEEVDEPDLLKTVEVVLMVVNEHERKAVFHSLKPIAGRKNLLDITANRVDFTVGQCGKFRAAVVQSEQGSQGINGAVEMTKRAIAVVKPSLVISVGVAFGLSNTKQSLGDVLVSRIIDDYTMTKADNEGKFVFRSAQKTADADLVRVFRSQKKWELKRSPDDPCRVLPGTILSGGQLVNNKDAKKQLIDASREAIGGEMEGAAIFFAVESSEVDPKPKAILIKAICDWGDGTKDKVWQPFAAHAAADYVRYHLDRDAVFKEFATKGDSH